MDFGQSECDNAFMNRLMKTLAVLLWTCTLLVLALIMYLSFQDGDAAKMLDNKYIIRFACHYYGRDDFNIFEMADIIYRFRQYGRILIFALLAFLGTATTHVTFYKCPWLVRSILAVMGLMAVAIFTEKYKMYLPTRHFSQKEMLYSIYGVSAGFMIITIMTFVYSVVKKIVSLLIA